MKRAIQSAALCMVLFVCLPQRLAADHIRDGGGAAEHNFTYALYSIHSYIDMALASGSPKFTAEEIALLRTIRSSLPEEAVNKEILQFKSGAANPGFFMIDGAVRVAITGQNVADAININIDLIYSVQSGRWKAMSIPECVAILIHELGHHHGERSHSKLDLLGAKVQSIVERRMTISEYDPVLIPDGDHMAGVKEFPSLASVDLSNDLSKRFDSHLYISDSFGTYDVTRSLMDGIRMTGDKEGSGANKLKGKSCWGSDFAKSENKGWRFQQFHLSGAHWSYTNTIRPSIYLFMLKAVMSVECINSQGQRLLDPGLHGLYFVIAEREGEKMRFRLLDQSELQKQMILVEDDEDFEFSTVMRGVLQTVFKNKI